MQQKTMQRKPFHSEFEREIVRLHNQLVDIYARIEMATWLMKGKSSRAQSHDIKLLEGLLVDQQEIRSKLEKLLRGKISPHLRRLLAGDRTVGELLEVSSAHRGFGKNQTLLQRLALRFEENHAAMITASEDRSAPGRKAARHHWFGTN